MKRCVKYKNSIYNFYYPFLSDREDLNIQLKPYLINMWLILEKIWLNKSLGHKSHCIRGMTQILGGTCFLLQLLIGCWDVNNHQKI